MKASKAMAVAVIGAVMATSASADAEAVYDDAAVSREFIRALGYFCGTEDPISATHNWILRDCCRNDTNRYVRVAKETATTNDTFSGRAIFIVTHYGTAEDIPFLRRYTNDARRAQMAASGVWNLGGITTNTLEIIHDFLAVPDNQVGCHGQNRVAECLTGIVFSGDYSLPIKTQTKEIVMEYARKSRDPMSLDEALCKCDPAYIHSKRRLSVLRSAAALDLCDMQRNYVTNAISELVAYPEANLPD